MIGVATTLVASSWKWRATGLCFAVGIAVMVPFASNTTGDEYSVLDNVLAGVGFMLVMTALILTVVFAGRRGLRYFAIIWTAATLGFGIGGFVDSNWASRYSPLDRCSHQPFAVNSATKQVWPPGVRCVGQAKDKFVGANAVDALILLGYSAAQGFLASFPLMGLTYALLPTRSVRPRLRPA